MNSAIHACSVPEANMHFTHRPDSSSPIAPARIGGLTLGLLAAAVMLSMACTAPGMKLNSTSSAKPERSQVEGLQVTLRALTPQVILSQKAPDPLSLEGLLGEKPSAYRIGAQDVLLVTVWDHPEITLPLGQFRTDAASGTTVDDEGNVFFPYIGKVALAGLTVTQARDKVALRLAEVLQKPQVDVKVVAFRSQKVYVGGEVRNPAVYNVTDVPFTLSEAIARSGGFLPTADDSRILLTRGGRTWKLDFQTLMASGKGLTQIILKDGDALHIPNTKEQPVYMLGELMRPGSLPLVHGNLTLAQAISDAGGIQGSSADARSIYVIRQTNAPNAVDVFHLDARNPTSMVLADRFVLGPRDIVYVDAGTLVRFSRVMSLLLPTVSAVSSTALTAAEIRYFRNR